MKKFEGVLAIAGLGLLAVVVSRVGWNKIVYDLRAVLFALPFLIALSALRLLLQSRTWQIALKDEGVPAQPKSLAGMRLASQALGYVTVFGPTISEPMKIGLLRNDWERSATGTLADSGIYWFAAALFGSLAAIGGALALRQDRYILPVLGVSLGFALALVLFARRRAILSSVTHLLGKRTPSWLGKGQKLEQAVRDFRTAHPASAKRMFYLGCTCQILMAGEALVVLLALKLPVHISCLLGIEAANRVVKMIGGWIPGRFGADESGAAAAFSALGLPSSAGVSLALARRTRDLLWCLIGLIWLTWRSRRWKVNPYSPEES